MADNHRDDDEVEFEAITEDYQLPDDFDPGAGEVLELNQSLPGYYSSMASMVNEIRHHSAVLANEYRRWIYEERRRLLAELRTMRDGDSGVRSWVKKIKKLKGVPFEMPVELMDAVTDLLGAPQAESETDEDKQDSDAADNKEDNNNNNNNNNKEKEEEEEEDSGGDDDDEDSEEEEDDDDDDEEEEDSDEEEDDEEEEDSDEEDEDEDDEEEEEEDEDSDDEEEVY